MTNNLRKTLATLLMGEIKSFTKGNEDVNTIEWGGGEKIHNGVWVTSLKYKSRPFASYCTSDTGEVGKVFQEDTISALLLQRASGDIKGNVVALHQHALNFEVGKSEPAGLRGDPEQAYGFELAQRGYSVLCFDFLGFEERQQNVVKFPGIQNAGERFVKQESSLDGVELMGRYVSDTMRAVDVLQFLTLQESIGVIGHSLGGLVAYYAHACDPRITASVSNCGVSTFDAVHKAGMIHNLAYTVHGMKREIGELHELTKLMEKRPLLISAARNDPYFPFEGVCDLVKWGRRITGCDEQPSFHAFDGGHSFPRMAREVAYNFLDQHLQNK